MTGISLSIEQAAAERAVPRPCHAAWNGPTMDSLAAVLRPFNRTDCALRCMQCGVDTK